jgi:hypothetical protein
VYIEMRVAPLTPADVYTMRLGGLYDEQSKEPPFVAGHEGVAVVLKVRVKCICPVSGAATAAAAAAAVFHSRKACEQYR